MPSASPEKALAAKAGNINVIYPRPEGRGNKYEFKVMFNNGKCYVTETGRVISPLLRGSTAKPVRRTPWEEGVSRKLRFPRRVNTRRHSKQKKASSREAFLFHSINIFLFIFLFSNYTHLNSWFNFTFNLHF